MRQLFKNRSLIYLWISKALSRFGDAFESLALMYLVYDLTGSALSMGTIMIFSVIPNIIFSPLAGVMIDRYNKNKIMFWTEIVRAITIGLIPVLMIFDKIMIWQIYLIAVVVSIAESFYEPCNSATFRLIVKKEELALANSLVATTNNICRIIGYGISGIVIAKLGKEIIFGIDALTFLISAIAAIAMKIPHVGKGKVENVGELLQDFRDGISYIVKEKVVLVILFAFMLINFIATPIGNFIPLIVEKVLVVTADWGGYLLTINIVGNLMGSSLFPMIYGKKLKIEHIYLISLILIGGNLLLVSSTPSVITIGLLFWLIGILGTFMGMWSFTFMQTITKEQYLGRVSSVSNMALLVATPLSSVIFGSLIDLYSIPTLFYYLSISCAISGVVIFGLFLLGHKSNKNNANMEIQEFAEVAND